MWYFLDKKGWLIKRKGRPFFSFIRTLLYCRRITKIRPDYLFPCWMCDTCDYEKDYVGPPDRRINCPKCESGTMWVIKEKWKPLSPGITLKGSKNPPIRPRPNIKVPAQVSKPKGKAPRECQNCKSRDIHLRPAQWTCWDCGCEARAPVEGDTNDEK